MKDDAIDKKWEALMNSNKDWIGNKKSTFVTLAASNHTDKEREENDYYATEPKAMDLLLEQENFSENIWECACGQGHLSKQLIHNGYKVYSTDLINRGFGIGGIDFLEQTQKFDGDIITNPPYKYAKEFILQALNLIHKGNKVAMFLKIQFLEGQGRKKMFQLYPPKVIYVSSSRLKCAINGEFEKVKSSAVAYAWFVWEKGYKSDPVIKWIN